jgi:3-phenylpropionate/trans-cinnamate dioxygenase ferredoxin reductase subunit
LNKVNYLIAGGGIAAGAAARRIRELDHNGSIVMISNEPHNPYHRPPLTKGLWTGKKNIENIFLEKEQFYLTNNIEIKKSTAVTNINANAKTVRTSTGDELVFDKLLLATGGTPRELSIPGSDMPDICYYRKLNDYTEIREKVADRKKAVVIGGGFIGSEIAAALTMNKITTTLIFPGKTLCNKVLPSDLGEALVNAYRERGVTIDNEDVPVAFTKKNGVSSVLTKKGFSFEADIIIAGIGITPNIEIARNASLSVANGIIVDKFLQTSNEHIFAAGDVALFPFCALNRQMRVEHWDNAVNQGAYAGSNMVSVNDPYAHIPYFFSDLFDFGYEAVGDVNTELEVFSDWKDPFKTGVIYYLSENNVKGIMLCNVWNKIDIAREIIGLNATKAELRGAL